MRELIKSNEINLRDQKEEYKKLKSGSVIELPYDIKEFLEIEGINYAYGMEWLKRNNKSLEENKRIVKNNPFIPYSIVLTLSDLERLKSQNLNIHTSFPIPIIIRENLERDFKEDESHIYSGGKVDFYVLFNENLLDEEELARILIDKEEDIESLISDINRREEDLEQYELRHNSIKFQGLEEKEYNQLQILYESKLKIKKKFENDLNLIRDEEQSLSNSNEKLVEIIYIKGKEVDGLGRKYKALRALNIEYEDYLILREERVDIQNNLSKTKLDIKSLKDEISRLKDDLQNTNNSRNEYLIKLRTTEETLQKYLSYNETELVKKDIEDVEARYKALTSKITSELKFLRESLSKAQGRFNKHEKDLIDTSNRLNIKEEEYIEIIYDSYILETIEKELSKITDEIKELNDVSSDFKAELAVKNSEIDSGYKRLKEECNETKLLPLNQIVLTEFKKRIRGKSDDLRKLEIELNNIMTKLGYYDNNLSSLAEYDDLTLRELIDFDEDIESLSREALDRFRGVLLRDYRQINQNINEYEHRLSQTLDKLLRNNAFHDDFFNKPLNTLSLLIKNPVEFIEQLMTTIRAYDDLVFKLEVDIALVDKEKERIIQILFEYISDIHKNLNKIDRNSTIKLREKPIKMLGMTLPDWEIEEYHYKNRLRDMVENLTQSGINRLEENENIEEIISPIITTNNLYNTVVGIGNIRIKLYKIEADRQYQIDWAEVSKNSGGEGFLSAFVILSSLLSFMRRDDTDIFAELEESKVLIMDNPFAQTSSSHLLEPLMKVAKKSNTQLIALTALGGEPIYNSFDNIYVLNLIPSKLKKGMQYLKGNHTKGEDMEIMTSSHVRTEEVKQLELF